MRGSSTACSKKETEEMAEELRKRGFAALAYHAGLSSRCGRTCRTHSSRTVSQVVCATVAFGMGIDKPDVRFVIHYDLPKTLEVLLPGDRAGRAGRETCRVHPPLQPGRLSPGSGRCWSTMIRRRAPPDRLKKLQDMAEYLRDDRLPAAVPALVFWRGIPEQGTAARATTANTLRYPSKARKRRA